MLRGIFGRSWSRLSRVLMSYPDDGAEIRYVASERGRYIAIYAEKIIAVRLTYDDQSGIDDVWLMEACGENDWQAIARRLVAQWEASTVPLLRFASDSP